MRGQARLLPDQDRRSRVPLPGLLLPAALAKERLTVPLLRTVIEQTLGLRLDGGANDATEFVTGAWPMFMAQFGGNIWHVHEASRPFFEDVESVAAQINELRLARVVRSIVLFWVSAWFSHTMGRHRPSPIARSASWSWAWRMQSALRRRATRRNWACSGKQAGRCASSTTTRAAD